MAKPGRNDPCPCGSGKKYKKCCLPKDEAEADAAYAHGDDEIAAATHVVVELVEAGKLAEAEAAARDLIMRHPDEPDGWDCLGIVHEASSDNRQAAECYRKMRDIMRRRPDDYEQTFEADFAALIDRLDPPTAR
jgi:predicted Zn-dependent protease